MIVKVVKMTTLKLNILMIPFQPMIRFQMTEDRLKRISAYEICDKQAAER